MLQNLQKVYKLLFHKFHQHNPVNSSIIITIQPGFLIFLIPLTGGLLLLFLVLAILLASASRSRGENSLETSAMNISGVLSGTKSLLTKQTEGHSVNLSTISLK